MAQFERWQDESGRWYWRLRGSGTAGILVQGDPHGYRDAHEVQHAIGAVVLASLEAMAETARLTPGVIRNTINIDAPEPVPPAAA